MSPALTAKSWMATLAPYSTSTDPTVSLLASMVSDIIMHTDDDKVAWVLDRYASRVLEAS